MTSGNRSNCTLLRLVYEKKDDDCSTGPRRVYIGNVESAESLKLLEDAHIQVIVNCMYSHPCAFQKRFEYLSLQLSDDASQQLHEVFNKATKFLQDDCSNKNVLVHCRQGVSRSVSVVLAWMIRHNDMNLGQALKHVRKPHPKAQPNMNFLQQLSDYALKLRGNAAVNRLQWCKVCSRLGFSEDYIAFSKCGHALCTDCRKKEINLLFCPHCLVEVELGKRKDDKASALGNKKQILRQNEILPNY